MLFDLLFIYQQEHYDSRRFLRFCYTTYRWWGLQKRQSLDFTLKIKLMTALYVLLAGSMLIFIATVSAVWLLLFILLTYALSPFLIVLCEKMLYPLVSYASKRRINHARAILNNCSVVTVGITGSYGKSSMKEILATILRGCNTQVVVTPGNINTTLGVAQFIIDNKNSLEQANYLIVEMGAYKIGNIRDTAHLIQPQFGFLTSVGPVHIERFGSQENIIQAKSELLEESKQISYINGDGDLARSAHVQPNSVIVDSQDIQEVRFLPEYKGISFLYANKQYQTGMLAEHNLVFIVMAIEFASSQGYSSELIRHAVTNTKPFEHRLEAQYNKQTGICVLDDSYNGNKAGFLSAMKVLMRSEGRKVVLTPGIVELGALSRDVHRDIAAAYMKQVDLVLLIDTQATEYMQEYFREYSFSNYLVYQDAPTAHKALASVLKKGDTILFSNDITDNYR